ncbi:hypothetical protein QQ054_29200 [Oscillatoria amoena NRMC-F 0135]|nr:hypothetical protein [Oscillatoria amoena NRMC-F 0135]
MKRIVFLVIWFQAFLISYLSERLLGKGASIKLTHTAEAFMKKTNSNMIVGFFRFIALMLVVMGMFTAAKAQPTNLNMYFINDSGYEDHEIWFSWQRMGPFAVQPSPTNQINYGVSNASSVTWGNGGSNLMSDMINYTNLYTTVNNHQYAAFSVVQATSANLYVTYGGVFSNLATALRMGLPQSIFFPMRLLKLTIRQTIHFQAGICPPSMFFPSA